MSVPVPRNSLHTEALINLKMAKTKPTREKTFVDSERKVTCEEKTIAEMCNFGPNEKLVTSWDKGLEKRYLIAKAFKEAISSKT